MRTEIQEALQRQLDEDVAADVWDELPQLTLIVEVDGRFRFAPVPIQEETWEIAEPYRVVIMAADVAKQVNERTGWTPFEPGMRLVGVAFFTEGHGLIRNDMESYAMIKAWMDEGHRLSEHPLSVEVKIVTAILADDLPIALMYGRGGVEMPKMDEGAMEGRVPDALTHMLNTFMAFTVKEGA
jgi:hypothetical protein